jgi:prevent-host-death family protein
MQTVSVSEFKAKALGLLEQISQTGESVVVTKRGKAIVKVVPFSNDISANVPGKLKGTVLEEVDVVSPLGSDIWTAAQ